jgi:membrane-associated phospholipid phosphatase
VTSVAVHRDGAARSGVAAELRYALTRLIPAAILLWAVMCGLGYLLTKPLHDTRFERWDGSIDRYFAGHRTGGWNTITHVLTYAAETFTVIGIGLIFFVGMRLRLGRWRESMFLLTAIVGEVTIFICTTLVIHRHRPAVHRLDVVPPTSSFPSGHAAAAVTLYSALAIIAWRTSDHRWLRVLAACVAVAAPICVAFSRLYRGMHYPTDVAAGVLLALVWLMTSASVVLRPRR